MERNTELANLSGWTDQVTLASSRIATSVDMGNTNGAIVGVTLALGKTIRCTEKANSLGLMGASTLETTMKIKKKAKGCSHGKTAVAMRDSGRMEDSMGRGSLRIGRDRSSMGNGMKAEEFIGLTSKATE